MGCHREAEIQLEGDGPWSLGDGEDDVEIIFTPGHTPGSISLLYKPAKALFSGDHLAYSQRQGRLSIFRCVDAFLARWPLFWFACVDV
jgi:glyoxylase-like metal-dependent hydrolase (beta-lactamase superfamily II)